MATIKKTAPRVPAARSTSISSCGSSRPRPEQSACGGGWVSKTSRAKTKKAELAPAEPKPKQGKVVSSCGSSVGWSRYGKIPSGC